MMKNSFVLYTEYAKHLSLLSMEQRGMLFTAIMAYETGEELPEMDGMTQMAFSFISEQLSRDKEKYETTCKRRSEAGRQGGRPREQKEEQEEKQEDNCADEEKQMLSEESKKSKCFSEKANESNEKQTKAKKPDNEDEDEYEDDNENEDDDEREILSLGSSLSPRAKNSPCEVDLSVPYGKALQRFLSEHPNVIVDNCSSSSLDLDYSSISREFSASSWLREQEHDLSWVARNAPAILRGRYRDRRATSGNDAVYAELWAKYDEEEKLKHG